MIRGGIGGGCVCNMGRREYSTSLVECDFNDVKFNLILSMKFGMGRGCKLHEGLGFEGGL